MNGSPHLQRHKASRSLDCLLISPPHWYPFQPYLALPALQAYLRQQGFSTAILDLNVMALDHFLTRKTLVEVLRRTERDLFTPAPGTVPSLHSKERRRYFRKVAVLADRVLDQVEIARDLMRGDDFYDYPLRHEAAKIIYLAMKIVRAGYFPTRYTCSSFKMRHRLSDPRELLAATESETENPFIGYMQPLLGRALAHLRPLTMGINITGETQVIGGMTAARLVKEISPGTHIVLGGSYFSRLVDQLRRFPHIFKVFDSLIVYEGEIGLAELISSLKNGSDLSTVPHHVWQDKASREVKCNMDPAFPDVSRLPTPDYQGMPLNLYLAPKPVLAVSSSRGCYWNRCAFCDHGFCYQNRYRERPPERVVDDMRALSRRHATPFFDIVDEAVKPSQAEKLSRCLIDAGLDYKWMCLARIDRHFSRARLALMHQAGCRHLLIGVESHDDKLLRRMRKGTSAALNLHVLANAVQAGLWTHMMIIFGFPGEDAAAAEKTMALITRYADVFHDGSASAFVLGRHARILEDPRDYGIEPDPRWQQSIELAYDTVLPYRVHHQDTMPLAEERVRRFQQLMIETKGGMERCARFLYCAKYETTDFSAHFKEVKQYDIHRRLGDLALLEQGKRRRA